MHPEAAARPDSRFRKTLRNRFAPLGRPRGTPGAPPSCIYYSPSHCNQPPPRVPPQNRLPRATRTHMPTHAIKHLTHALTHSCSHTCRTHEGTRREKNRTNAQQDLAMCTQGPSRKARQSISKTPAKQVFSPWAAAGHARGPAQLQRPLSQSVRSAPPPSAATAPPPLPPRAPKHGFLDFWRRKCWVQGARARFFSLADVHGPLVYDLRVLDFVPHNPPNSVTIMALQN